MVFKRLAGDATESACIDVVHAIAIAEDREELISEMVTGMRPLAGYDREESSLYVADMLAEEVWRYDQLVPPYPDDGLAYETDTWNPIVMITSTFAHGSWSHVIFNLIFFAAFAATVEGLIGTLWYVALIVAVSLFNGFFDSMSAIAAGQHFSSLGLSGVVMGMIGVYAYLLPNGRIRCYYWFIVIFGSVAVPAWALALWFIGGDIWQLFASDDHGMVNVLAHVTGGIGGYLFGLVFLRKQRFEAKFMQSDMDKTLLNPGI
jgi:membrane associated rhomboid family serine protease